MKVELTSQLAAATDTLVAQAVNTRFASELFAANPTLWGTDAEDESSRRLGWVHSLERWYPLVEEVEGVRAELAAQGVNHVVLCGMGGSSLAPEVTAAHFQRTLTVVDTTHPNQLGPILSGDLSATVVVVASKSGGTLETDSQKRAFEGAFRNQGIDPADRIIVVTDPDTLLHKTASEAGYRVFLGDEDMGGRFSVLGPFGIVPCVLAGIDMLEVLQQAQVARGILATDSPNNPGIMLGAGIAVQAPRVNKVILHEEPGFPGFGDWVEQLVAESSGKDGVGLVPVLGSHDAGYDDSISVGGKGSDVVVQGTLGELFLLWEVATAFACQVLGVNPFDQPNVESAKIAAKALLETPDVAPREEWQVEGFSLWSSPGLTRMPVLDEVLAQWKSHLHGDRYGAVCVFGNQKLAGAWKQSVEALEAKAQRPVTLGFGPRFLHSTGQLHKGGPAQGVFLQVIQVPDQAAEIPGRDFDFGTLMLAQAHGDANVLANAGLTVLSVTASTDQLPTLWEALES